MKVHLKWHACWRIIRCHSVRTNWINCSGHGLSNYKTSGVSSWQRDRQTNGKTDITFSVKLIRCVCLSQPISHSVGTAACLPEHIQPWSLCIPVMQQPIWWGEKHRSLQLGFLVIGRGTIWQVASSRIATHSIALPILSTSATPNNHYLPHLCCAPCEHHTEHHHRSQRSTPSSGKSNLLLPPVPGALRLIQTPDSWLRGTGEKYWLETTTYMQVKLHNAECAWQKKKLSTMTYMCLYTRGKLADTHTHATHYQFRA